MTLCPRQLFHNKRVRRVLVVAALALCAWSLVAWVAARALVVSAELPRADSIVVLAGSSTYRERTRLAAELFREGRAPRIVLTNDNLRGGWSNELQRNPLFVERAAAELRGAGVPSEAIEMLPQVVSSTHDEALVLREHAETEGLRSLLLVTSAYHSRRALRTFRKVFEGSGITIGLVSVPPGDETPPASTWWLHARGWQVVAGEYVKLVYYRLRY
ncbi:MAG TPA: YdcF family protein [Pyrinomonadaceae bacterium]|nr:YdcF family protein [Pyrinomonadaceae bacterium]